MSKKKILGHILSFYLVWQNSWLCYKNFSQLFLLQWKIIDGITTVMLGVMMCAFSLKVKHASKRGVISFINDVNVNTQGNI